MATGFSDSFYDDVMESAGNSLGGFMDYALPDPWAGTGGMLGGSSMETPNHLAKSRQPMQMAQASASANPNINMAQRAAVNPSVTSGSKGTIDNSSRAAFVQTAYPYMLEAAGGDPNLAQLMLAKAISENGDVGKGGGFIGNNFSGIKGQGSAGSFTARTWEQINGQRVPTDDTFAAYSTPEEGFRAFMSFLQNNSRYANALARYQATRDADTLFTDINRAGYATDPNWANAVRSIRDTQVGPALR